MQSSTYGVLPNDSNLPGDCHFVPPCNGIPDIYLSILADMDTKVQKVSLFTLMQIVSARANTAQ